VLSNFGILENFAVDSVSFVNTEIVSISAELGKLRVFWCKNQEAAFSRLYFYTEKTGCRSDTGYRSENNFRPLK